MSEHSHTARMHDLYSGVLVKRFFAFAIDIIFMLVWILFGYFVIFILAIPTLGLALFFLSAVWLIVYILYIGLTLGGPTAATPGMRIMGLEMTMLNGGKPGFSIACFHALLFWILLFSTIVILLSFIFALFNEQRRTLHDVFAGVVIVNRF